MANPRRILIMGLPGAGKTTLAQHLKPQLEAHGHTVTWLNADAVRQQFDDWDFSPQGRIRQSHRMRELADASSTDFCIADFIAPLTEMRRNFGADWTVWMDTINTGRYEDTNKMFQQPDHFDFRITEKDAAKWAECVVQQILKAK